MQIYLDLLSIIINFVLGDGLYVSFDGLLGRR